MKNKNSVLLTSLVATLIVGGCASNTPTSTVAGNQTSTMPQSATASVNPNAVSSTSTVQPTNSTAKPAALAVYFEYDSFTVRDQYANAVRYNAEYLAKNDGALELDGNADERGSREYNMALGQKRADAVKRTLTALGAKSDRIDTISFGEDKPKATGSDETAWAENRRVDFVLKGR